MSSAMRETDNQDKLIISPMLNFVQRSFNTGINKNDIIRYGLASFDSTENFEVKHNLRNKILANDWVFKWFGTNAKLNNLKNFLTLSANVMLILHMSPIS